MNPKYDRFGYETYRGTRGIGRWIALGVLIAALIVGVALRQLWVSGRLPIQGPDTTAQTVQEEVAETAEEG